MTLINYVSGSGFKANGVYCTYDPNANLCTNDFVYYDGTGFKPYTSSTNVGYSCPSVTAVDYDGTGFKGVSRSMKCTKVE